MRVIAGKYRSRVLKNFRGLKLRPTSDRLRETLFNVIGLSIEGARFIDVYAGTGAVGIEALSRGAAEVIFIEKHATAANLIRQNLDSLGITSGATLLAVDALRGLEMLQAWRQSEPGDAAEIMFLDPPYAEAKEYESVLRFLGTAGLRAKDGRVIVEHRRNSNLPETVGNLHRIRLLRQGDATLSFYLWNSGVD